MPITSIDSQIVQALEHPDLDLASLKTNSYRRGLPDMLRRNGPLQTLAFLLAKDERQLLDALTAGLAAAPGVPAPDLKNLNSLAARPLALLALSQRLTRVAVWIDRLVEAKHP